jgi:hypothetical protein
MAMLNKLLLVAAILVCAGCASGPAPQTGDQPDVSIGGVDETGYLPFVEEVMIPEGVRAKENFQITLRISSALNPNVLRGLDEMEGRMLHSFGPHQTGGRFDGWLVTPWQFGQGSPSEPIRNTFNVRLLGLPEGDWVIRVVSAPDRDHGGLSDTIAITPWYWSNPLAIVKEYPIHILPAEEGGS